MRLTPETGHETDGTTRLYLGLKARGFTIHTSGDQLSVAGPPLTDDERGRIRDAKPVLLGLMAAISAGELPPEADQLRRWLDDGRIARVPQPFEIGPGRVAIDLERCVASWIRDAEHGAGAVHEAAIAHVLTLHQRLAPVVSNEATEEDAPQPA